MFQVRGIGKPPDSAFHHKIKILSNNVDILFNKTLEKIEHAEGKKAPEIAKLLSLRLYTGYSKLFSASARGGQFLSFWLSMALSGAGHFTPMAGSSHLMHLSR